MKKISFILCPLLSLTLLCSCALGGGNNNPDGDGKNEVTQITMWTFPVGNWGNNTTVSSLLAGFHKAHPDIHVTVEFLDYDTGDAKISEAAEQGELPDFVLEGPERLVANWGVNGLMADLSDLWETEKALTIYPNVSKVCKTADGAYYEFPICMTTHCMAINYDMFEEAGVLEFLDLETHTWTTDDFAEAVTRLQSYYGRPAGEVYCKNQAGDQGTRALVTNLYGGSYTNEEHTQYVVDSEQNIAALELLRDGLEGGIEFTPENASSDAISRFCKKETAMCFCWNASLAVQQIINNSDLDFTVVPMAFPTDMPEPELQGGIWGFGVFDNGDEKRISASKTFISYLTENDTVYSKAVITSSYWPVRKIYNGANEINIYENDEFMTEYGSLMRYMGDYYQVADNWQDARYAWWNMLAKVGAGTPVAEAIKDFPFQKEEDTDD